MHGFEERLGPYGESLASDTYRKGIQESARDALAAIVSYRRGEFDALRTCRTLVNDPYLREIVPIELLRAFIVAEAQFDLDLDVERADKFEPAEWADLCAERDEYFASEDGSIVRDWDALAVHLEQWQRDNPPRRVDD